MATVHTPLVRSLPAARTAFDQQDVELSKAVHAKNAPNTEEGHNHGGDVIKSVVFGGLDGILTTFAIVSGATGGGMSTAVILILGFSNKISDALSMGLGDALSTKAEHEHVFQEREREFWEFDNFASGEVEEMIELYESKGMSREDATTCITLMAEHRDFFVDLMLVEELGLQVPDEDANPWFDGFVTFCSFIVFGFMPLLGYCVFPFLYPDMSQEMLFAIACVVTAGTLFVLGSIKSRFSPKKWWKSGMEMLAVGGAVALVSWSIGFICNNYVLPYLSVASATAVSTGTPTTVAPTTLSTLADNIVATFAPTYA